MPPEMLQGKSYTSASEVYVLAVLVYEMLTGKRPFCPETDNSLLFPAELLEMQQLDAGKITAALPAELSSKGREVLLKALAFEPANRFQTPVEFADEFAGAAVSNTTTAPAPLDVTIAFSPAAPVVDPATPPPISMPANFAETGPKNKKPILIAAALVSLLLIVGLTAGGIWFANRPRPDKPPTNESVITPAAQNSLQFWLNVQKMRDGKSFQEPFKSSSQQFSVPSSPPKIFHPVSTLSLTFTCADPLLRFGVGNKIEKPFFCRSTFSLKR